MPTMNLERVVAAIEEALDEGGNLIIRFGHGRMRTLRPEEAAPVLAALKERSQPDVPLAEIPKGWKMVPMEATFSMHNAAAMSHTVPRLDINHDGVVRLLFQGPDWSRAWTRMVDAAPPYNSPLPRQLTTATMTDISARTEAEAHAVLEKPQAWITYRKKNGAGTHTGTISTNPDYVRAHKDWLWQEIKLPEPL